MGAGLQGFSWDKRKIMTCSAEPVQLLPVNLSVEDTLSLGRFSQSDGGGKAQAAQMLHFSQKRDE